MFKENFIKLCNQKDVSPSFVCRAVGLAPATFSCWTDESVPRKATLMKLADYFDVTVDYLLGKTEEKKPLAECEGLTEQEQALINYFRSTSEQGKMKIIQNVMNICDEIEKKDTASNTKHSS